MFSTGVGVVPLQFGGDLLLAEDAAAGKGGDYEPAHLRIHGEVGGNLLVVQPAADQFARALAAGNPDQGLGDDELRVGTGFGILQQPCQAGDELHVRGLTQLGGHETSRTDGGLRQHRGDGGHVLLRTDALEGQGDQLLRGDLGVANRVPEQRPGDGAGQRVGQPVDPGHQRVAGHLVEADLREGEVPVVQQDHVAAGPSDQSGHLSALTGDIGLHVVDALQAVVGVGVDADSESVGAQRRPGLGRGLDDREPREGAGFVNLELGPQGVDPRAFQPLPGEPGQVAP